MSIVITAGQRGDSPQFEPVLEAIRVARIGKGRPRKRPDRGRAGKAYGSRENRAYLRRRGIRCTVPENKDLPDDGRAVNRSCDNQSAEVNSVHLVGGLKEQGPRAGPADCMPSAYPL